MNPREWRIAEKLTLADMAAHVGLSGKNPASTYLRWETGKSRCPLVVVHVVERISEGRVTLADWIALAPGAGDEP